MRNRRASGPIALILAVVMVSGCVHHLGRQRAAAQDDLESRLHSYFAFLADRDRFGGYALVAQGDEIRFSAGYGFEDNDQKHPFTEDSPFAIASVTKQFTAAAILACRELGLLSLEDSAVTYLPALELDRSVTIRRLLTHTSGLGSDRPADEAFAYSNEGYDALGSLVEAVSGIAYDAFLQEHVCEPAGLRNTYVRFDDGSAPVGAGDLVSTPYDLFRWSRHLVSGTSPFGVSYRTLTEDSVPALPGVRYGFGVGIREADGSSSTSKLYWHAGSAPGTAASLGYLPDLDVTVVILSDSDRVDLFAIERDVYRLVIDAGELDRKPPRPSPDVVPEVHDRGPGGVGEPGLPRLQSLQEIVDDARVQVGDVVTF